MPHLSGIQGKRDNEVKVDFLKRGPLKKIPTNVVLQNNGKRLWKINRIEGYNDCERKTNNCFSHLQEYK